MGETYKFTYFEHIGFADIASRDYLMIDDEEYLLKLEKDEYYGYRGRVRIFPYLHGKFFRRYNSELVEMKIQLREEEFNSIIEKTKIEWDTVKSV